MTITPYTQELLNRIRLLLPVTEDEIVQRGITETATARIVEIRQRIANFAAQYKTVEALESHLKTEGVSADDHTLYVDLLEWKALRHELAQFTGFLENV